MTDGLLAWHDGTLATVTDAAWAKVAANFLGAGFRIDLPVGDRSEAARYEWARVQSLADLLGTSLPDAPWAAVVEAHPDHPVEIVGGWTRSYAMPAALRVATRPVGDTLEPRTAAVLPTPSDRRPSRGLPTISRLADEIALRTIDAEVGIWADPEGTVATSTAGPVLAQRADGTWVMGTESATWLAQTIGAQRSAEATLTVRDLDGALFVAVVRRALGLMPLSLAAR